MVTRATPQFGTAQQIIDYALGTIGLDPSQVGLQPDGTTASLGKFFWHMITSEGITSPSTINDIITINLPHTAQFKVAFPGYDAALEAGHVQSVAQYVATEEGITQAMLSGGVPKSMINPTFIGDLIAKGNSVNEVANRVSAGLDAARNSPPEVQNMFLQEFGDNGPDALAHVFLDPTIDLPTLMKMYAGAQIGGAAQAAGLTVSQGLSQRLADQGQTYASAQQAFRTLNQEAGLFQQTQGEALSQTPVAGTTNANRPLSESDQGVNAAFGLNAADEQQVRQVAESRQAAFRGGGGATQGQSGESLGLGQAKVQ